MKRRRQEDTGGKEGSVAEYPIKVTWVDAIEPLVHLPTIYSSPITLLSSLPSVLFSSYVLVRSLATRDCKFTVLFAPVLSRMDLPYLRAPVSTVLLLISGNFWLQPFSHLGVFFFLLNWIELEPRIRFKPIDRPLLLHDSNLIIVQYARAGLEWFENTVWAYAFSFSFFNFLVLYIKVST